LSREENKKACGLVVDPLFHFMKYAGFKKRLNL
jgi:hypothetical protein